VNIAARLEGLAEPGGICVARTVYNHVRNKLALPFEPMGTHRVKNIAEPVEVWRVALDGVTTAPATRRLAVSWPTTPWLISGLAALLTLVFLGGVWHLWPGAPPPKGRPAMAVLPFDNLGGDEATGV
jgi:hypothetical protein